MSVLSQAVRQRTRDVPGRHLQEKAEDPGTGDVMTGPEGVLDVASFGRGSRCT